jgi:hypothetical protein
LFDCVVVCLLLVLGTFFVLVAGEVMSLLHTCAWLDPIHSRCFSILWWLALSSWF